ncbi:MULTISPECIES: hypothetical protein [unclassified Stenotrophomonas]
MRVPLAFAIVANVLLGLVIEDRYVPNAPLELKAYRSLTDAEFGLMLEEAEMFAGSRSAGLEVSSITDGQRFFELQAHGQPVMLADNSSTHLLVVIFGEAREQVPDLVQLEQRWQVRTGPDLEAWHSSVARRGRSLSLSPPPSRSAQVPVL